METTVHEPTKPNKRPPVYGNQNAYYELFFRRPNALKEALLTFFYNLCSWPRLVLEVFLRRNMGERYFSMGAVWGIFFLLLFIVYQFVSFADIFGFRRSVSYACSGLVIFDFVFLWNGFQRAKEVKRLPSVFDFQRFSLSTGTTHPFFNRFTTDRRKLTIWYEPGLFFLTGLGLLLLAQIPLAIVLINCSIIYSMSYVAAYHQGDNYLMDRIDKRICDEDLAKTFRDNIPYEQTRGAEYFGYTPEDPEKRQRMASVFEEEPAHRVS